MEEIIIGYQGTELSNNHMAARHFAEQNGWPESCLRPLITAEAVLDSLFARARSAAVSSPAGTVTVTFRSTAISLPCVSISWTAGKPTSTIASFQKTSRWRRSIS